MVFALIKTTRAATDRPTPKITITLPTTTRMRPTSLLQPCTGPTVLTASSEVATFELFGGWLVVEFDGGQAVVGTPPVVARGVAGVGDDRVTLSISEVLQGSSLKDRM